jgi:hypothetical protein
MAKKKKKTVLGTIITVAVIAAVIWMKVQEVRDGQTRDGELRDESVTIPDPKEGSMGIPPASNTAKSNTTKPDTAQPKFRTVSLSSNQFQIWKNCTLIDRRGNDGDSFHIQSPQGNEEIRLYYVDAPESAAIINGLPSKESPWVDSINTKPRKLAWPPNYSPRSYLRGKNSQSRPRVRESTTHTGSMLMSLSIGKASNAISMN